MNTLSAPVNVSVFMVRSVIQGDDVSYTAATKRKVCLYISYLINPDNLFFF